MKKNGSIKAGIIALFIALIIVSIVFLSIALNYKLNVVPELKNIIATKEECNYTNYLEHGDHEYILEADCLETDCPQYVCPACMCNCAGIDNTDEELFSYEDLSIGEQQSLKSQADYILRHSDCYNNAKFNLAGNYSYLSQYLEVMGPDYDFDKIFNAWIITRVMDGSTQQLVTSSGKIVINIDTGSVECNLPEYVMII